MSDSKSEELIDMDETGPTEDTGTVDVETAETEGVDTGAVGVETLDELLKTKNLRFRHLYNGILGNLGESDEIYPVVEFKIDHGVMWSNAHSSNCKLVFPDVDHSCGWFYLDLKQSKMFGPLDFDVQTYMESGGRRVRTDGNGEWCKIQNESNDPSGLIPNEDLPDWMYRALVGGVGVKIA